MPRSGPDFAPGLAPEWAPAEFGHGWTINPKFGHAQAVMDGAGGARWLASGIRLAFLRQEWGRRCMIELMETVASRILAIESAMLWSGILMWLMLSALVGAVASGRAGSGFGYFLLALLLSPIVALAFLLFAPDQRKTRIAELEARLASLESHLGRTPPGDQAASLMPAGSPAGIPWLWPIIILIMLVGAIAGVGQLGRSANTTFTVISDPLDAP